VVLLTSLLKVLRCLFTQSALEAVPFSTATSFLVCKLSLFLTWPDRLLILERIPHNLAVSENGGKLIACRCEMHVVFYTDEGLTTSHIYFFVLML
jgi:hypothetical protein